MVVELLRRWQHRLSSQSYVRQWYRSTVVLQYGKAAWSAVIMQDCNSGIAIVEICESANTTMLLRGIKLRQGRGGPWPPERALQTRRKAEWRAERPAVVLTSHSISGSHRCKRRLVLPTLPPV
jgi:hypothetical protein